MLDFKKTAQFYNDHDGWAQRQRKALFEKSTGGMKFAIPPGGNRVTGNRKFDGFEIYGLLF